MSLNIKLGAIRGSLGRLKCSFRPNNNLRLGSTMTKVNGNSYFQRYCEKDVWNLVNEAAADAASNPKNANREIINLGQGYFTHPSPDFVIEEAKKALDVQPLNQYAPPRGTPNLVKALTDFYSPIYGRQLGPENVQVTTGANEGILSCLVGLLNAGDEVILIEPFFDQYVWNIIMVGGVVRYVPMHQPKDISNRVTEGPEWQIDYEKLAATITDKTKAIILNNPHNPLAKVFTREELLKIGNLCVENNVYIIADEVYENLYYGDSFTKIATLSPEIGQLTLSVGSAGKLFAVTGWRVGWVISENPGLLDLVNRAHTRICFCSPTPLQEACAKSLQVALHSDYTKVMRKDYITKAKILTDALDDIGVTYTRPEGAYFIMADFSKFKIPEDFKFPLEFQNKALDYKLVYWLLNEIGIVFIPCSASYSAEHCDSNISLLRLAFCKDDAALHRAANRLRSLKEYL
ncbi:HBR385Cp [Eremothecium sinecaudum]|uniref:HBR385Cp n=1 Tax=Eremothecium sinecaudum TaxID=45286 RepID=A0A109UXD9_9SACH|nr:HBR385Cp [Eremothecium sinecaudum]AMD19286.1 HBR385Cp [Eremothecium sinecaudum]